jgi:hypothetical protein
MPYTENYTKEATLYATDNGLSQDQAAQKHDIPQTAHFLLIRLSIHTPYSIRGLMVYGIWNATHMELNPYIWKSRNDVIYIVK